MECSRELDQWTLGPRNNYRSKATNPHVHKVFLAQRIGKARKYYNPQPCLFITSVLEVIAYSNEIFGYHRTYLRLPLLTRVLLRELSLSFPLFGLRVRLKWQRESSSNLQGRQRNWLVEDNNRAMVRFKEVTHCRKIKRGHHVRQKLTPFLILFSSS